jgi:hypothetical protein
LINNEKIYIDGIVLARNINLFNVLIQLLSVNFMENTEYESESDDIENDGVGQIAD